GPQWHIHRQRSLHRLWIEAHSLHGEEFALVGHARRIAEELLEQFDALVHHVAPVGPRTTWVDRLKLVATHAEAEAEKDSSLAVLIKRRDLFGEDHRIAERRQDNPSAEPDSVRACRAKRDADQRLVPSGLFLCRNAVHWCWRDEIG